MSKKVRALGLLSGGLDSTLACALLMDQGIEVEGINFYTGFCIQHHTRAMRNPKEGAEPPRHDALHAAQALGIELHIEDISEEYVRIVTNPKYGYGKNVNPCLDCKIFMVEKAWQIAREREIDFLFTGEVMGQRPMSQRRDTMPKIQREAGVEGWLLRPLCALRLPETEPEKLGLVDRSRLKGFTGRSRKPQMALAEELGIKEYPSPAGGCCFLTDESYADKLRDLWSSRGTRIYTQEDIMLLKAGRHLRPAPHFKLIIGRDRTENGFLRGFRQGRIALHAHNMPGPLVLVEGDLTDEELTLCCRLTARFGKSKNREQATIAIERGGDAPREFREVPPMPADEIPQSWYI